MAVAGGLRIHLAGAQDSVSSGRLYSDVGYPDLKVVDQILLGGDEYQDSFAGKLAEVEIYHYALSADVIGDKFKAYQQMLAFQGTDGRK